MIVKQSAFCFPKKDYNENISQLEVEKMMNRANNASNAQIPLAFIPKGETVRLKSFGEALPGIQREQLHAYGLVPDCELKLLQRRPLPVILTDEMEIALEISVARHIWVEPLVA